MASKTKKPSDQGPDCCSTAAYNLMSRLAPIIEAPGSLLAGAVAIAKHENPKASLEDTQGYLRGLIDTLKSRVRGPQPQAKLAHLHELLFVEEGFIGNSTDYHNNPKNSYLPDVLESKTGLPITLSMIYKIVGDGIGLKIRGVGLPGHFCVGAEIDDGLMIVDPFYAGRILTPAEATERVKNTYGSEIEWSEDLIKPVSNRHWLTRTMQNLLHTFSERDRKSDVAAMLELEVLLWPDQTHLMRDLGQVLARDGKFEAAIRWLKRYLAANPNDPQKYDLNCLIDTLSGGKE